MLPAATGQPAPSCQFPDAGLSSNLPPAGICEKLPSVKRTGTRAHGPQALVVKSMTQHLITSDSSFSNASDVPGTASIESPSAFYPTGHDLHMNGHNSSDHGERQLTLDHG